jgi:short-subunit dehydrogenase
MKHWGRQKKGDFLMATALITGASSGIGMEMARLLAMHRTDLVLVARREEILLRLKEEIGKLHNIEVRTFATDLTDRLAVDGILKSLKEDGIAIDILINSAGFGIHGKFAESDLGRQQEMIDLNISALTRFTHHVLPGMIHRGKGRILNIASTAAFQPGPMMSVYCATKAYVLNFSEALAAELKGTGVTVTVLCPGPVATEFFTVAGASLKRSLYVKLNKPVSSREVAQHGLKALMTGKSLAIHGRLNWLTAFAIRFAPRKLTVFLAHLVMKS